MQQSYLAPFLFHQTCSSSPKWFFMASNFIEHFCTNGGNFLDERGLKSELRGFLDTLQISCGGLKMHQAWMVYSSNLDYVGRCSHMIKLWQIVLVIPASTASCERGFSTQNHIKSTLRVVWYWRL